MHFFAVSGTISIILIDPDPGFREGWTLSYHLAYWIAAEFPHVGEKMLQAASKIASGVDNPFFFNKELGFETLEPIPLPFREKFRKILTTG